MFFSTPIQGPGSQKKSSSSSAQPAAGDSSSNTEGKLKPGDDETSYELLLKQQQTYLQWQLEHNNKKVSSYLLECKNAADVKDRVLLLLHRAQFAHTHTGDLYRGMSFIFLLRGKTGIIFRCKVFRVYKAGMRCN